MKAEETQKNCLFDENSRQRIFEQILGTSITGIFALFGVFLWNSASANTHRSERNTVNIEANREVFTQQLSVISTMLQKLEDKRPVSKAFDYGAPALNVDDEGGMPSGVVEEVPVIGEVLPQQTAEPNFSEQIQRKLEKEIYRRSETRGLAK